MVSDRKGKPECEESAWVHCEFIVLDKGDQRDCFDGSKPDVAK